jgi:hypothetical protein
MMFATHTMGHDGDPFVRAESVAATSPIAAG